VIRPKQPPQPSVSPLNTEKSSENNAGRKTAVEGPQWLEREKKIMMAP
jgi:hypothetical protein